MGEYKFKTENFRRRLFKTAIVLFVLFFFLNKECLCRNKKIKFSNKHLFR
jgi:hypothetical protein